MGVKGPKGGRSGRSSGSWELWMLVAEGKEEGWGMVPGGQWEGTFLPFINLSHQGIFKSRHSLEAGTWTS